MSRRTAGPSDPLIDVHSLAARLGRPDVVVLDAGVELPRPEFDGDHRARSGRAAWLAAHVPGARHLDLLREFADSGAGYHFSQPLAADATTALRQLGVGDGTQVVVYDGHDGLWAARAWWSLRALGLPVRVLDGGLRAWQHAGLPVRAGAEAAARTVGALTLHPDPDAWADRDLVLDVVRGRRRARLVCALDPDQFDGTVPTRYARRGHIPGSVNLPARSLSAPDGTLLLAPALREAVERLLDRDDEVVLYCGGGISAARTALGLVVAGYRRIRIYDGSVEEWAADPRLPLELTPGT